MLFGVVESTLEIDHPSEGKVQGRTMHEARAKAGPDHAQCRVQRRAGPCVPYMGTNPGKVQGRTMHNTPSMLLAMTRTMGYGPCMA